jgi:flagellar protein FlbD
MIELTSINGEKFFLNNDLIYKVEQHPDTIITLVDGKTLRVKETPESVSNSIIEFKKKIYTNYSGEIR